MNYLDFIHLIREAVIMLLLETGKVDVNALNNNGHSAFWRAEYRAMTTGRVTGYRTT